MLKGLVNYLLVYFVVPWAIFHSHVARSRGNMRTVIPSRNTALL
jgi:hypothetical protein